MRTNPLLIDCVLYNGDPVIAYRLQYLYSTIDKFVIVEARYTYTGIKKERLYIEQFDHIFKPYLDKLIFYIIESFPNESDTSDVITQRIVRTVNPCGPNWFREAYQRDAVQLFLLQTFTNQDFLVFVCDVDEIPNRDQLRYIPYNECHEGRHMQMKFFMYNSHWKLPEIWTHPFIVTNIGTEHLSYTFLRGNRTSFIDVTGWHFGYHLTIGDIIRKLQSFSHHEFNTSEFKNRSYIRHCIENGIHFLFSTKLLQRNESDILPEGWKEFEQSLLQSVHEEDKAFLQHVSS
jgi:beta-1,4-mannosyl-glycoprotein beta-1,4-N-acetylglucosaminyltransferase